MMHLTIIYFAAILGCLWCFYAVKVYTHTFKEIKMLKNANSYIRKLVLIVILFVFVSLPCGCSSYDQMGQTAAEGQRRHLRNQRIARQQLMADLDTFFLLDKPGKLTDKRIP